MIMFSADDWYNYLDKVCGACQCERETSYVHVTDQKIKGSSRRASKIKASTFNCHVSSNVSIQVALQSVRNNCLQIAECCQCRPS